MDTESAKTKEKIRRELADYLGTEPEDIDDESILTEDLHMKASDLTDFSETLSSLGFDTSKLDFTEAESFIDLVDAVTARE